MLFMKKALMGLGAFLLILWGGAGTQSNSTLLQGGGFLGLIIGLVVLYIFAKMAWRAMGCLPSIMIIFGIIVFIIYAIGGFNNGVSNVGVTLKSFLGQQTSQRSSVSQDSEILIDEEDMPEEMFEEDFYEEEESQASAPVSEPAPRPQQQPDTFRKLMGAFGGQQNQQQAPALNMNELPVVSGRVSVVTGDTLRMKGKYISLYGIDAPEIDQTCANKSGRSYHCGKAAARWLSDWLINADAEVDCRILQKDSKGNMVGVCSLGPYDIGAAMANAGWAVAYTKYTDIYVPYEQQARQQRVGLWQGRFYKPWDWRKIKASKPKIKVKKPKKKNFWD